MRRAAIALLMTLAPSAFAVAQCEEGRVVSEQTAGRCCWPAQAWNAEAGRCEGPPRCPSDRVAEGDTCVSRATPAATLATPSASPAPSRGSGRYVEGPPPVYSNPSSERPAWSGWLPRSGERAYGDGFAERGTTTVQVPYNGVLYTGVVMMATAYTYSIVTGAIFMAQCCGQNHGWPMFIPLVGGFIWPATVPFYWHETVALLMGIPGAGVQVLGFVLALVGGLAKRTVQVPRSPRRLPELAAGPGDLGASLRWDF